MSFDLNFGRHDGTIPSVEEMKEYFRNALSFQIKDSETSGPQFWYENDATGVYCVFSYCPDDVDQELDQFSGSGLTFNLNYIRPSFFAYETMPLVQRFCENFDLLVEDVQEEKVEAPNSSHLIDSWHWHNERAVKALSQEKEDVELRYLPEQRATEWWQYTSIKKSVEDRLTEDIFVPTIMIMEDSAKRLFTMIVWTDGIAQFFPPCDYVLVTRNRKRLFGNKEEVGLVSFEGLIGMIGPSLDEYDLDSGAIKYLSPNRVPDVVSAIRNFTLSPIDLSQHTRLAADAFHDVNFV